MIKIIFFGDITGEPGRKAIRKMLPQLLDEEQPDLVLANVENLAHGKGVTVKTLEELIRAGVKGFTSGNHIFSKRELSTEVFHKYPDMIVRPANFPETYPGKSAVILPTAKGDVLLGNFMGQVFMEKQFPEPVSSPFQSADAWFASNQQKKFAATIIDFHAEATSEKIAFGYHLSGRATAVLGTHTHVPTADAKVLSEGTAYITDVGMCGAADSVLGVKKELSLERFLTNNRVAFDIPEDASKAEVSYVIIEADESSGKATKITSKHQIININESR
ncbi:MAG: YmdB family metallophosphoesterase [Candidatus Doudnabacteria bacterium]|nr:YmdB family metallophosphoesterase [Candidatus Doudnabacteria bacterium]